MNEFVNPADPLRKAEEAQRELFGRLLRAVVGFPLDTAMGATANLVVNILRQSHATRKGALDDLDRLTASLRFVLAEHYDAAGKRRNIFPFHQVVAPRTVRAANGFPLIVDAGANSPMAAKK